MRIIFQIDDKGNVRTELFEDSVTLVPKEKEIIRLHDASKNRTELLMVKSVTKYEYDSYVVSTTVVQPEKAYEINRPVTRGL